ncbi:MAG: hypothetical protein FJ090_14970 [Deltaproteobacteria bacterium]|nr:hypothetical protein [Deltaproteobacteria bacterium]
MTLLPADPARGAEERGWTAADFTVRLAKTGEMSGTISVVGAGREVYRAGFEKTFMDGAEREPLDLHRPTEIGRPTPVAAWDLAPGTVLLLENRSYEGVNWQAIHLTDEGARDGGALWLYLCAF